MTRTDGRPASQRRKQTNLRTRNDSILSSPSSSQSSRKRKMSSNGSNSRSSSIITPKKQPLRARSEEPRPRFRQTNVLRAPETQSETLPSIVAQPSGNTASSSETSDKRADNAGCSQAKPSKVSVKAQVEGLYLKFIKSTALPDILTQFAKLCHVAQINPANVRCQTFRRIRELLITEDLGKALWKCLEEKTRMKVYLKQRICYMKNVLVIGCGPCGLRMAIECALLGARVTLIEKRLDFFRWNLVSLLNFAIVDMVKLGFRYLDKGFCVDVSVYPLKKLQINLTKIALLLGVTILTGVDYQGLSYPEKSTDDFVCNAPFSQFGACSMTNGLDLSKLRIHLLVCASGEKIASTHFEKVHQSRHQSQSGIGVCANFVKSGVLSLLVKTRSEPVLPSLLSNSDGGGTWKRWSKKEDRDVTFRKFIDNATRYGFFTQNSVIYSLDKNFFISTAIPTVLHRYGALKSLGGDLEHLIGSGNVDEDKLAEYIEEAACFHTRGKLHPLEICRDARGNRELSVFPCTPHMVANHSVKLIERNGKRLMVTLVGDSLINPCWKTGSGVSKGFLGVFDAAWAFRHWALHNVQPKEVLKLRETLFCHLKAIGMSGVNDYNKNFSIDPETRYRRKATSVDASTIGHLLDSDGMEVSEPIIPPELFDPPPPPEDDENDF